MKQFPVMQYDTKYGIDIRVGANEANIRSGSKFIGYLPATDKRTAIRMLKHKLELTLDTMIWRK